MASLCRNSHEFGLRPGASVSIAVRARLGREVSLGALDENTMAQSNGKKFSFLGALALLATITGTSAVAAQKTVAGGADRVTPASAFAMIPTDVDNPTHNEPDGTCSMCLASSDGAVDGSSATIEIYFEDNGEDFSGDFELTLLLNDSTNADASILGTSIAHQDTRYYTVNAGSSWDWNDVDRVNIEAIPDI